MPGSEDKMRDRVNNVILFPGSRSSPTSLHLLGMTKTEKALHIRHKILNDDLPEDLLDEMLRILEERERDR